MLFLFLLYDGYGRVITSPLHIFWKILLNKPLIVLFSSSTSRVSHPLPFFPSWTPGGPCFLFPIPGQTFSAPPVFPLSQPPPYLSPLLRLFYFPSPERSNQTWSSFFFFLAFLEESVSGFAFFLSSLVYFLSLFYHHEQIRH